MDTEAGGNICKRRDTALDLFKTLLVVGMVWAHCYQLLSGETSIIEDSLSLYVNLITFSGFMFAFGWASQIAYFSKLKAMVKRNLMRNFFTLLLVYYISAFGYYTFMGLPTVKGFLKIIYFWYIPGYSEFLLSFAVLMMVVYLFFDVIIKISQSKKWTAITIVVSLVLTWFPGGFFRLPAVSAFLGVSGMAGFPIVLYSMFFLGGVIYKRADKVISRKYLTLICVSSVIGITYCWRTHSLQRFPPDVSYLMSAWIPIMAYVLSVNKICCKIGGGVIIHTIGKHTLLFLLVSNLIIFALNFSIGRFCGTIATLITAAIILGICYGLARLIDRR